jgi:hypothetical protein
MVLQRSKKVPRALGGLPINIDAGMGDAGERHPVKRACTVNSASIDERAASQNAPGTTIVG